LFTLYVVALPLLLLGLGYSWLLLPLVAYGALALVYASARAVKSRRPEYAVLLPLLFLWIHLAYGAGFLSRFLKGGWSKRSAP
jgi:hypothetical protein